MRISDWSSDVCSSDLRIIMTEGDGHLQQLYHLNNGNDYVLFSEIAEIISDVLQERVEYSDSEAFWDEVMGARYVDLFGKDADEYYKQYYAFEQKFQFAFHRRSEEHTSELQSLMRISYAVFCLKKKKLQTAQYKSKTSDMCNILKYNVQHQSNN